MGSTVTYCCLHFSLSLIVFWPTYSSHDISILSYGPRVHFIKLFTYTNPLRHLRAQSGFRHFFSIPLWRVKKSGSCLPCTRFCSSFPSHFCSWSTTSFYCSAGVLSCPDEHARVVGRRLSFSRLSSSVSSCALFGIYPPHSITNRQCLFMVSAYFFGLAFFSSMFHFSLIINFPNAPQFCSHLS